MAALGYATRHLVRTGRPEGGSGALTDAVASTFSAAGGRTRFDSTVASLIVGDGAVRGVELVNGERLHAPIVVTACDPHRVLVEWIGEVPRAAKFAQRRWRKEPDYEGYEAKIDAIVDGRAELAGTEQLQAHFPSVDLLEPTAVVSPKPSELAEAHRLRAEGKVAPNPTILMNLPSVLDATMRPSGSRHVLSLEMLFTPYSLQGGWPNSAEPRRWLDIANRFWRPGFEPAEHEVAHDDPRYLRVRVPHATAGTHRPTWRHRWRPLSAAPPNSADIAARCEVSTSVEREPGQAPASSELRAEMQPTPC